MTSMEFVKQEEVPEGKRILRKSRVDPFNLTLGGVLAGGLGAFLLPVTALLGGDAMAVIPISAALAGIVGTGATAGITRQALKANLADYGISNALPKSKFSGIRSWSETRQELVKEKPMGKDKVLSVTLIRNKQGVWIEELWKADPMESWDKVLDSLIEVHHLEKADALLSLTQKDNNVPLQDKVFNVLLKYGVIRN